MKGFSNPWVEMPPEGGGGLLRASVPQDLSLGTDLLKKQKSWGIPGGYIQGHLKELFSLFSLSV